MTNDELLQMCEDLDMDPNEYTYDELLKKFDTYLDLQEDDTYDSFEQLAFDYDPDAGL